VLPNTLRNLISPLVEDPRVGAVAGNVRVLNSDDGPLAKMLDLAFTHAFEFMRASESEVAAVMCCPGALSAYRRELVDEFREAWIAQAFLGAPAAIGEDRSMTNHVLRRGHHVRFQSNAIVLTEVPTNTPQLARMFLRWARSNVRESLVLAGFVYRRFRSEGRLGARINATLSYIRMIGAGLVFVPVVVGLITEPGWLPWILFAALVSGLLPAAVFATTRCPRGALWAFPYSLYSLVCLTWISPWSLLTAHRSGWLTRQRPAGATSH
jgi:hyaluronan synthase